MGVAVNGMHFTGMYAMAVEADPAPTAPTGFMPILFVAPIALFVIIVFVVLLTAFINRSGSSDDSDPGAGALTRRLLPEPLPAAAMSDRPGSRIAGAFGPRPNR